MKHLELSVGFKGVFKPPFTDMTITPNGDRAREATDALRGYVYQIYQSCLAWIELRDDELLFLEVAEDFSILAAQALEAVQVKATAKNVTINSSDIVTSIDSFVALQLENPDLQVRVRHLTTSSIGREKLAVDRIGDTPALESWRKLAKGGDVDSFRKILENSKLATRTKGYIRELDNEKFRGEFLKRIHFDCGALDAQFVERQLRSKLAKLLIDRGGIHSQVDRCFNSLFMHLLTLATKKTDRVVDRHELEILLEHATKILVSHAQLELQNQLINQALTASLPQTKNIMATGLIKSGPIDDVPFQAARASRTSQIDNIEASLLQWGVSWIYGAAGVGKTFGARLAAWRFNGNWATVYLRGLNTTEVDAVLSGVIETVVDQQLVGLLVDDLECSLEPYIVDKILWLLAVCDRSDILIIITTPKPADSNLLFRANLTAAIAQKFEEFTEDDIKEILVALGVNGERWARYIFIVSGRGHPQLAIAAIQSMQSNGWDVQDLRTLGSLISGNYAIDDVRARTRERLLNELPEAGRRLLERLSLKIGGFRRSFMLDMAQIKPVVTDAGIIFDRLIGSWIDQSERDRFELSPLLSGLAHQTLTTEQSQGINFEIAESLLKAESLSPAEANAALIAAFGGKNDRVLAVICSGILHTDQNQLERIAPHLVMLSFLRTDTVAYSDNLAINQLIRGAQLVLISHEEGKQERIEETLACFEFESDQVENPGIRNSMMLVVYLKVLLTMPKFGAFPKFWELVRKLDRLFENQDRSLPSELLENLPIEESVGVPILGFMFLNQTRQIKKITELLPVFDFLDWCGEELRHRLLKIFDDPDFDVDMLMAGCFVAEHQENSVDPKVHSSVVGQLEEITRPWGYTDLSVCFRKYRVILIDEYGGNKDAALKVLDEGLELYGEANPQLLRGKAKVLFRAADHEGSLAISKMLIDGNAPCIDSEKAFLSRDAAISAEKLGDYATARRFYLFGSVAAKNCGMAPMVIGLMADAALASWHMSDRERCLRDFVVILQELNEVDQASSLNAAHCHAVCRHVLLWLDQEATGKKRLLAGGEEITIYPGIVSNPEPSPEIDKRHITPIEMAWYMLAAVENNSLLDVGITLRLATYLPKGPVVEGQFLLTFAIMKKSLGLHNIALFVAALGEVVTWWAFVKEQEDLKNSFDTLNVTYGSLPVAAPEQQHELTEATEQLVLGFVANSIFEEEFFEFGALIDAIEKSNDLKVRMVFLDCLRGSDIAVDYVTSAALLLVSYRQGIEENRTPSPIQVFELIFIVFQIVGKTINASAVAKSAFKWLSSKWDFISEHQRFLLKSPAMHEKFIAQALKSENDSVVNKTIGLLQAILPILGIGNESELKRALNKMLQS